MMDIDREKACSCGSGIPRTAQYDGYGIFLTFTCTECYEQKISKFRKDIFTRYKTTEPIEEDDGKY